MLLLCFLDTGGDRTYVLSDFVNKTKPTVLGKQHTSYSTFGDTKVSKSKLTRIFSIDLVDLNNEIHKINAIESKVICKPLYGKRFLNLYLSLLAT